MSSYVEIIYKVFISRDWINKYSTFIYKYRYICVNVYKYNKIIYK